MATKSKKVDPSDLDLSALDTIALALLTVKYTTVADLTPTSIASQLIDESIGCSSDGNKDAAAKYALLAVQLIAAYKLTVRS